MMNHRLLPPNSTAFERALADATGTAFDLPVPLRELWNPWTCPAPFLPYLAWALSVDHWNPDWSENEKREVIAASFDVHKHKGTLAALRRVIDPFGVLIDVTEWWQETPPATPGTFRLRVGLTEVGIDEARLREMERLIQDAKPLTRHLTGLTMTAVAHAEIGVGCATLSGQTITVYPWIDTEEAAPAAQLNFAAGVQAWSVISVYPDRSAPS